MDEDKVKILVEWLKDNGNEVSEEDVEEGWGNNSFSVGGNAEYLVCTDEEADEAFEEDQRNIIDDLGIESYSDWFQDWIINNCVDTDWFEEALREEADYLAGELLNESVPTYANRLVEECYDNNLIGDDDFETDEDGDPDYEQCTVDDWDLQERYKDWYVGNEDAVEWYKENFGEDSFNKVVKEHDLIDWDAVIEETRNNDGRGSLATYDGKENEFDYNGETYYIYRTN